MFCAPCDPWVLYFCWQPWQVSVTVSCCRGGLCPAQVSSLWWWLSIAPRGAAGAALTLSCNSDLSDETQECRAAGSGSQSADSGQAGEYHISPLGIGFFFSFPLELSLLFCLCILLLVSLFPPKLTMGNKSNSSLLARSFPGMRRGEHLTPSSRGSQPIPRALAAPGPASPELQSSGYSHPSLQLRFQPLLKRLNFPLAR